MVSGKLIIFDLADYNSDGSDKRSVSSGEDRKSTMDIVDAVDHELVSNAILGMEDTESSTLNKTGQNVDRVKKNRAASGLPFRLNYFYKNDDTGEFYISYGREDGTETGRKTTSEEAYQMLRLINYTIGILGNAYKQ